MRIIIVVAILLSYPAFLPEGFAQSSVTVLPPYSLEETYILSLQNSESLKIQDQQLRIAEANYRAAVSQLYPQVDFRAEYVERDNVDFGRVIRGRVPAVDDPAGPAGGNLGQLGRSQTSTRAVVTQPIFNGFREFLLADAAQKETEAVSWTNIRARELLYLDVSDLFFQIAFNQAELKVVQQAAKTLRERVDELKEFIELGKSRESEVYAAMADLADMQAVEERILGLTKATKELLAFLTALPANRLSLEVDLKKPVLLPQEEYLKLAKERSDIRSQLLRAEAQKDRVTATKRQRWPAINFLGNGYGPDDPDRNREWDLIVELSLPVFDWGRISAQTEAEEARLEIVNLETAQRLRLAERDIRFAYTNTVTAMEQIDNLKKLKDASSKNYELQKQDYKNGVVTNLEVLQSIRQLQEAERRLLLANQEYFTNYAALRVAAGGFMN